MSKKTAHKTVKQKTLRETRQCMRNKNSEALDEGYIIIKFYLLPLSFRVFYGLSLLFHSVSLPFLLCLCVSPALYCDTQEKQKSLFPYPRQKVTFLRLFCSFFLNKTKNQPILHTYTHTHKGNAQNTQFYERTQKTTTENTKQKEISSS